MNLNDVLGAMSVVMMALEVEIGEQADRAKTQEELEDLKFVEDMHSSLSELSSVFQKGGLDLDLIRHFREEFLANAPAFVPPEVLLEQELREIAEGIDEERWWPGNYQRFHESVQLFLEDGLEDQLWETIEEIEQLLDRVAKSYAQTTVLPDEVTLESQITHKLLVEGVERWQSALLVIGEADSEPDWPSVLEEAEYATRLLVAIQIYNERLKNALNIQNATFKS